MGAVKIGINGFGRIGFLTLRAALQNPDIEVVAVNHKSRRLPTGDSFAATLAHTLKYDSIHGNLTDDIHGQEDYISINDKKVKILSYEEPAQIPWRDLGVEIVVESTGRFRNSEAASGHLQGGAKKVVVSAPMKDKGGTLTVVMGVNEHDYIPSLHHVVSNASCTTNCAAPVVKVLHNNFSIKKGLLTTVHAITNDQQLLDMPSKDLRRGRAGMMSIIPTTTGAASAIGLVMPELKGKLNGCAMRVPVPNVSIVDLVVELEKPATKESVNAAFQAAAAGEMNGILGYSDLPLVSSDYNGDPRSSIVDGLSTMTIGDNMVKVLAWYDNEWGYSNRIIDLILYMQAKGL
ncbi:MAG: type I glyceraldehyde-3-phosphate dehydrogenase [bacterium]|jgi:glyceraldehyde 3-phosphate dehydrogenase